MVHIETKIENFTFYLAKDDIGLTYIDILEPTEKRFKESQKVMNEDIFINEINQIKEYLTGVRKQFTFKTHFIGTDFQKSVWEKVRTIPYGETKSYQEIAILMGNEKKVRAVANAIGRNPLLLYTPCHRVLYKNYQLGGFSSGIENKVFFLSLEAQNR